MKSREQILEELKQARALVRPYYRDISYLSDQIEGFSIPGSSSPPIVDKEFLTAISQLHTYNTIWQAESASNMKWSQSHRSFAASSKKIPVNEIFRLLKDGYEGNLNRYLQEILSNATLGIRIIPQNDQDKSSRQILEVKIQVAATAIDNYAGLLTMILGQSKFSKGQETIIGEAHKAINSSASNFQLLQIGYDFLKLRGLCSQHMEEHASVNCFSSLFKCHTPGSSKLYKRVMAWFDSLRAKPMDEMELIGAVYFIRSDLDKVSNKYEKNALRDNLDAILHKYDYPAHTDSAVVKTYIEPFIERALHLNIDWPSPFQPSGSSQANPLSLTG